MNTRFRARIRYFVDGTPMDMLINVEEGNTLAEARAFLESVVADNKGWGETMIVRRFVVSVKVLSRIAESVKVRGMN